MYTVPIESLRKDMVPLVGGKGASLGELVSAGAPVPPGFVVTSRAYRAFLEYNGIDRLVARLDSGGGDVGRLGEEVRRAILAGELPSDLAAELERAGRPIADWYVAVRSSATYEDSPDFSFAGMHDTYLGVHGGEYLQYVKRVWASNFEERALSYKLNNGIPPSRVLMAVVVQKLVDAKAAGVMFTLNPANGDRSVVAIESSWGLGEAVVQGEVTPDSYRVSKVTGEILKANISCNKRVAYYFRGGRVAQEAVDGSKACAPSLTEQEAVRLAEYGVRLERHFGYPVDVEWAVEGNGAVYVVQSRPETVWSRRRREEAFKPTGDIIRDMVNVLLSMKTGL